MNSYFNIYFLAFSIPNYDTKGVKEQNYFLYLKQNKLNVLNYKFK